MLLIDIVLFVFNVLPIYPLDGGQILRSLLWFVIGRGKSLMTASVLGFLGVAGLLSFAAYEQDWWLGLIALYAGSNCWSGFKVAQAMVRQEKIPRRLGYKCPSCKSAPPIGPFWGCANCHQNFDTFESGGRCPHCAAQYDTTTCLDCRRSSPRSEWMAGDWTGMGR